MDLRDRLEALTDAEPPHRPVATHLAAGRRALRRRRVAAGAAVVTAVAVLGGGWAAVTAGGEGRAVEPAGPGQPAPSAAASAAPSQDAAPEPEAPEEPWATWRRGDAVVADGVTEVDRISVNDAGEPMVALELRVGQNVRWYLVGADGSSHAPAFVAFDSLADWVSDQLFLTRGEAPPRDSYVRFTPDGGLEPAAPGVRILEQVRDPDLPDSYDGGDLATAAARIEVDGEALYLLARDPAAPDVITVPVSRAGPTLEDFLDFARERYGPGEGGGSEGLL